MGTSVEANLLLESYLKQLRLPGFLGNYRKFAEDAAQTNLSFDRYLLALAEQEIAHASAIAKFGSSKRPAFRCSRS